MTESDKTGEKLAASIRKTKAGTATPTTAAARKTAPKRAPSARPAGSTRRKPAQQAAASADPYHHGQRVWPD
ncbi:MAG: hypothetical protein PVJ03_00730 [Chromatiaceae bacterium]|jgi:hypothetical protein